MTVFRLCAFMTLFLTFIMQSASGGETQSDVGKEKRWADQIVDQLIDGDAEWLTDVSGHKFLSLYTQSETVTKRAAIISHGTGVHPDWQEVILPLRTLLPENGWASLSIQMPILKNEAEREEYEPLFEEVSGRIEAAIAFLKSQGYEQIILVSHSLGADMSAYYLANMPNTAIKAFVGIGMGGNIKPSKTDAPHSLKRIKIPLLDLYGSADLPEILKSAPIRQSSAETAGNGRYKQVKLMGANHFFEGKNDELLSTILEWLNVK